MYKEVPVQNRVIEKRVTQVENDRHRSTIRRIMNAPVRVRQSS